MKRDAHAGWWLALVAILALWSMAAMVPAVVAPSAEHGFGVLQWKTA